MKRVIIAGGTGAIGSALINEMIKNEVEVLVLCHAGSIRNQNIFANKMISKKYYSLNHLKDLQNDMGKSYDVFYHLAWSGTVGEDRNDMHRQNLNVSYALDAVEAAARFGCHTFIGAGSQAEYGRVHGMLRPETPTFPENGYGMAKLCAGQMTRLRTHQLGMRHIWTRILSVYGPNDGAQSMVMSAIQQFRNGEVPRFTKGEQIWDYLYSEDAARAFYALGEKGIDGKTYVLGSGQGKPLSDYIKIIRDVVSPASQIDFGAIPYGENQVMFLQADISQLEEDTGWEPRVSFEKGIKLILKNLDFVP